MGFGFGASPVGGSLNTAEDADNQIMGTATPAQKRVIRLTPFGYEINGTGVANPDWHPETGETITMMGRDDAGRLTKTLGTYQYMGEPPGAAPSPQDHYGLPGIIANFLGSIGGRK